MKDEDKPFVCCRKGRWNMHITPRNRAGGLAMGLWVAGLLAVVHSFIWLVVRQLGETTGATVLIAAGIGGISIIWIIAMTRWMLKRSEIINMDDVLDFKRDRERQRRNGRNRRG